MVDEQSNNLNIAGTELPAIYFLPLRAVISAEDEAFVKVGDVIAHLPQKSSKTHDITGGLPRVADLFEACTPRALPF